MSKKGLLVVSFGTSFAETRKKNIEHVEMLLASTFPDRVFYHAYTSKMILKKLKERDQITIPTVSEAMEQIKADGITDLLIQPTHIINGIENDLMKEDVLVYQDAFTSITFGDPLLTSTEDIFCITKALVKELPALTDKEALIFMGHGSEHYANTLYAAVDYTFKRSGHSNIHMGTVEAYPKLDTILPMLKEAEISHVYLTPFMLVAGDHATNDLAGDEDSWKTLLEAQGYRTTCVLKGLGEYDEVCDLYIHHAKEALAPSF